jgi:hypothetical protein
VFVFVFVFVCLFVFVFVFVGWLNQEKKRVRALYDFPPQYPGELELKEGDVLEVIKQDGEWYEGTHTQTGATGWFPVNYVEEIQ